MPLTWDDIYRRHGPPDMSIFARKKRRGKRSGRRSKGSKVNRVIPKLTVSRAVRNGGIMIKNPMFMKYCQSLTLTSSATQNITGGQQVFRLNSVYDPDYSGGGHQPYSFDQITPFFGRYTVVGCYVRIDFYAPSVAGLCAAIRLAASNELNSISSTDQDVLKEEFNACLMPLTTTGIQRRTYKRYVDIAKLDQVPKLKILTDDQYSSNVTTNPTLSPYIQIALVNQGASSAQSCLVTVTLNYKVRFGETKTLAQS